MANPVNPTHPIPEGTFHNVTVHHVNRDERGNANRGVKLTLDHEHNLICYPLIDECQGSRDMVCPETLTSGCGGNNFGRRRRRREVEENDFEGHSEEKRSHETSGSDLDLRPYVTLSEVEAVYLRDMRVQGLSFSDPESWRERRRRRWRKK